MGGLPNHQYVNSESEHDGEDISGLEDIAEDPQGASSHLLDRARQSQSHTVPGGRGEDREREGGGRRGPGERRWREERMGEKREKETEHERARKRKKGTEYAIKDAVFPNSYYLHISLKNNKHPTRQHSRCIN